MFGVVQLMLCCQLLLFSSLQYATADSFDYEEWKHNDRRYAPHIHRHHKHIIPSLQPWEQYDFDRYHRKFLHFHSHKYCHLGHGKGYEGGCTYVYDTSRYFREHRGL
jgi:hypothetical protein